MHYTFSVAVNQMSNCNHNWVGSGELIPTTYLSVLLLDDQIKRRSCVDIARTSLRVNYEIERNYNSLQGK